MTWVSKKDREKRIQLRKAKEEKRARMTEREMRIREYEKALRES